MRPEIIFLDGMTRLGSDHGFEAAADYLYDEGGPAPKWFISALSRGWPSIVIVSQLLGIGAPTAYLLRDDQENGCAARFLSGTSSGDGWAFCLFWKPHALVPEQFRVTEVITSAFHEMAHAYVESCGREAPMGEEDTAEAFGCQCADGDYNGAIERLKSFVEQAAAEQ